MHKKETTIVIKEIAQNYDSCRVAGSLFWRIEVLMFLKIPDVYQDFHSFCHNICRYIQNENMFPQFVSALPLLYSFSLTPRQERVSVTYLYVIFHCLSVRHLFWNIVIAVLKHPM